MSRTTLCVGTAALLVFVSVGVMSLRSRILGDEVRLPGGPGTWKITMLVQGKAAADAHVWTATPLHVAHQRMVREQAHSDELVQRPPQEPGTDRRELSWTPAPGFSAGPFRIRYECFCAVRGDLSNTAGIHAYAAPKEGEYLKGEPGIDCNHAEIAELARRLTDGVTRDLDQAESLYQFVEQRIALEPNVTGSRSALDCLHRESGGSAAKSRLLAALCRNRGIPARLLTGLILADSDEQGVHTWVEAWAHGHWLPMCPTHHHFGKVPRNYLVFAFGDHKLARGKNVRNLESAFLVEHASSAASDGPPPGWGKRFFRAISLNQLPLAEQQLVEILLLLPVAALIICVFRNVIGLASFGTFTPALIGLAFRDLRSWPGVLVFVGIILAGWLLRRMLNRFHLLQVPRVSLMLSLVITMLIAFVVVSNCLHWPATRYISLFPLIILTSMIERFWTLEEEDGTRASFRTLLSTLFIAGCISLMISRGFVIQHLLRYPETVGLMMAGQMLLGRYTGYRLSELYRFRDFVRQSAPQPSSEPIHIWSGTGSMGSPRF